MKTITSLIDTIKEHFRLKLIICFIICSILPILILGTISYRISYSIARDNILKEARAGCENNQGLLENRMNQIDKLADSILLNLSRLCRTPDKPLSKYLDTVSSIRTSITSTADNFNLYHVNIFLPDDSFAANEGLTFCSLSELKNYNVKLSDFSNQGISSKWIFRKEVRFPYMVSKNEHPSGILSCYRFVRINSRDCCFAIHITSDELSSYLNQFSADNPSLSYIVDSKGIIVSSTDQKQIGTSISRQKLDMITQNTESARFTYDNNEVISAPVNNTLFLVTETPDDYIRQSSSILVKIIFICVLIIVPLTMFSIIWIGDQMTNKIHHLSHAMAEINMDNVIDTTRIDNLVPDAPAHLDEIDTLTVTCANMISELNCSFENNLNLKIQEEKLNYQLLQSQINPHFLYNILASVQNLLSFGEIDKADKMLSDLSRFYRGLLRTSNDLISIKKELEIAQLYMQMEALCKNHLFDWDIETEDGIENFLICKFTLQPILENSIQHGLKGNGVHMHIHISIIYDDDMIEIRITDDGIGMPAEKLNELRESLASKQIHYEKHFGMSNINSRICSSLQGHGTLEIKSTLNAGTTIIIRIPQLLEDC